MNSRDDLEVNSVSPENSGKLESKIIQIDEKKFKDHLGKIVKGTIEEVLNAFFIEEADRLCGVTLYERSERRVVSVR